MAQAFALSRTTAPVEVLDWARRVIVGGCGLALILAGPALPF